MQDLQHRWTIQRKLKGPRPRPLEHQGETSTPTCGPRARDDNNAHNDHYKRVFEATQTSKRDTHAKIRAKKKWQHKGNGKAQAQSHSNIKARRARQHAD
eukprot:1593268-Pleurochrysis_carterae.AAC.3